MSKAPTWGVRLMFRVMFDCAGARVGGCAAGCDCGCAVCAGGSADGFARVCAGGCSCDLVWGAFHSERCAALGVQGSWLRRSFFPNKN
eukprot:6944330-Pyramimonas_sp.AAC.1